MTLHSGRCHVLESRIEKRIVHPNAKYALYHDLITWLSSVSFLLLCQAMLLEQGIYFICTPQMMVHFAAFGFPNSSKFNCDLMLANETTN